MDLFQSIFRQIRNLTLRAIHLSIVHLDIGSVSRRISKTLLLLLLMLLLLLLVRTGHQLGKRLLNHTFIKRTDYVRHVIGIGISRERLTKAIGSGDT